MGNTRESELVRNHFLKRILDAPVGTITEIVLSIDFRPCISWHNQKYWDWCYIEYSNAENKEVDPEGLRAYILKIFEEKDKCLEPWLVLNADTMKRIGMKCIDIKYKCGLTFDDCDDEDIGFEAREFIGAGKAAWKRIDSQTLQTCVSNWKTRSERCSASYDDYSKSYTVKLRTELKS